MLSGLRQTTALVVSILILFFVGSNLSAFAGLVTTCAPDESLAESCCPDSPLELRHHVARSGDVGSNGHCTQEFSVQEIDVSLCPCRIAASIEGDKFEAVTPKDARSNLRGSQILYMLADSEDANRSFPFTTDRSRNFSSRFRGVSAAILHQVFLI